MNLTTHAICILIMISLYLAFQAGKMADERRKRKERERIWKREQARLPKALKVFMPIAFIAGLLGGCTKAQPTNPARIKKKCTCMPYQRAQEGHADTLQLNRG